MAVVHVSYYTDPACPRSWAAEPWLRRLRYEFAEELRFTYVMSGHARDIDARAELAAWLDAAAASGMPVDPRLWLEAPPASTYPASMAVKAAAEQGLDEPYLRVLREGFAWRRRKLDTADALVEAAREVAGIDVERFRNDLGSHAIVEAFGADLDRAAAAAEGDRIRTPWLDFRAESGAAYAVGDRGGLESWRAAALGAGAVAQRHAPPTVEEALRLVGRLATPEVAALCELPGPLAAAALWDLAVRWRIRPERALAGELWSIA